jgi:hypothetical protein
MQSQISRRGTGPGKAHRCGYTSLVCVVIGMIDIRARSLYACQNPFSHRQLLWCSEIHL